MKWALYNILFLLVYPFLLPGFLLRMCRRGGYVARMGDRFALYPSRVPEAVRAMKKRPVWLHAVSVGEVQVAGQLMREWRKVEPDVRFVFSTTSSTGWKMAEKEIEKLSSSAEATEDKGVVLIYNPLDFPTFVKAALLTFKPRAIVLTESEIWPNFLLRARKMGIPRFLINARVSDRSAPRYKAARWFFGELFAAFTKIFAQSELDAARIRATYGRREATNIEVSGSFKFDVAKRNGAKEEELRKWIFPAAGNTEEARKILLGGSTWPGEDEVLLKIYQKLGKDVTLVIAPRHFEKADAIEANIKSAGFECVRRSRGDAVCDAQSAKRVFLADTTGELMGLYGISEVVFVGKSLCAHGSQNMIEPCLCGKTTFVGPYTENFRPVMSDLLEAGAITQVRDAKELEEGIVAAFAGKSKTAARAQAAVEKRRGVVERCVASIREAI